METMNEPDYLVAYKAARANKHKAEREVILAAIGEHVKQIISAGEDSCEVECKEFYLPQICSALEFAFPEFEFRPEALYFLIGGSKSRRIIWNLKVQEVKS